MTTKQTKQTKLNEQKETKMNVDNRFDLDIEEMSEKRLILPVGKFPSVISKLTVVSGEKENKEGEMKTWFGLDVVVDIKDSSVSEYMQQDSPKGFMDKIFISLDKESSKIAKINPDFWALLSACGLKTKEAMEIFIEAGDSAEDKTIIGFNKAFLEKVASTALGSEVISDVKHKAVDKSDVSKGNRAYVASLAKAD